MNNTDLIVPSFP